MSDLKLIAIAVGVIVLMIGVGVVAFIWSRSLLIAIVAPFVVVAALGGALREP